jgi:hypothetical protein
MTVMTVPENNAVGILAAAGQMFSAGSYTWRSDSQTEVHGGDSDE